MTGSVDVVSFRPEPSQFAWTFGGVDPIMRVAPGTVMELWTEDAFGGKVRGTGDLVSEVIEFPFVNPQTGPFYVEGAEPGDTLALHFVSIEPSRDWAASSTIPLFGALTSTHATAGLQEPLPEIVWMYEIDTKERTVTYHARDGDHGVALPLDPMHGTVGLAPASFEARSSLVPDAHGGNMDTPEMRAGTTCYLGVNVEGALFSIGDGHARQGEGETCGVAVECAMDTVLVVDLIKGREISVAPPRDRRVRDEHRLGPAPGGRVPDSQVDMVQWIGQEFGLSPMDAYQLLTQVAESPVANVCDPNYTFVCKVQKRWLPDGNVMGGVHARLRRTAAAYLADRA